MCTAPLIGGNGRRLPTPVRASMSNARERKVRPSLSTFYVEQCFSPLQKLSGGTKNERQPRGVKVGGGSGSAGNGYSGYLHLDESGALRLAANNLFSWQRGTNIFDWHFRHLCDSIHRWRF
jgi:hypothetical protein